MEGSTEEGEGNSLLNDFDLQNLFTGRVEWERVGGKSVKGLNYWGKWERAGMTGRRMEGRGKRVGGREK